MSNPPGDRPSAGQDPPVHHERLTPAWWTWLLAAGLAASVAVAVVPVGATTALVTGVLTAALSAWGLLATSPAIRVADGVFQVGRARIPVRLLGRAEALDPAGMRNARGPGLDTRAFLCLRGWVPGGIRVEVRDPEDPTPYWLVSSRRPAELVRALGPIA